MVNRVTRIVLPLVGIALVDAVAILTRNTVVFGGMPLAFLVVPGAALLVLLALMLTSARARRQRARLPPLPGNIQVMGASDSMAVAVYVLNLIAHQEIDPSQSQETMHELIAYLKSSEKQDQVWQVRLAVVTTVIGLIGGWLPSLVNVLMGGK